MKRYDNYKSSGVEWIGDIPESWNIKKLKFATARKKFAIVDGPFGTQLKADEYIDEGVPLVRITNLSYVGKLSEKDIVFISEEKAEEIKRSSIGLGDIVIGKTGATIGKSGLNDKYEFGIIASSCIKISPDSKKLNSYFLKYFICSNNFQTELVETSGGSTRDTINIEPFKNLFCIIPSIEEQTAIAKYLDEKTEQIDKLIANKRRLIELLKEERTAIINQAVTKGINSRAKLKPSGIDWLGDIPEHWEVSKMKNVCRVRQGLQIPISERFPTNGENYSEYITIKSIHNPENPKEYISNPSPRVVCNKDDILVARTGATGEIITGVSGAFHNNFFCVDYDSEKINKKYFYYYLSDKLIKDWLLLVAGTTTIPDLNHGAFYETPLTIPSMTEQFQVVEHIETQMEKIKLTISKVEKEIELIQEYRTALISEVVTGKIKVV
jgi:restriction endonuclease S subunit